MNSGIKKGNSYFSVFCADSINEKEKLYIATIGKKILKKSVDRSLLKRRLKEVFNRRKEQFTGKDVVIMVRSGAKDLADFRSVEETLGNLLSSFSKGKKK